MPKKLTIEDVKIFLKENDTNCECTLLSSEYINNTTPLKLKCNLCGEIYYRDYAHLKRGRYKCSNCSNKSRVFVNKSSIQEVKSFLEQYDIYHECTLISQDYINSTTKLELRCNCCGNIFYRDFNHIKRKRFRCEMCGELSGAKKLKYTEEQAKEILLQKGYKMTGQYINASTPFEAICSNGHQVNIILSHFLVGHSGCRICANKSISGENHYNWKGGESEVIDILRKSIKEWKKDVLARDNYTCCLTGSKTDLVVHHLIGFNTIVNESIQETKIPLLRKLSDYDDSKDFLLLKEAVLNKHTISIGITLAREVHDLFHSLYGKGNNTLEQFEEFYRRYYE